MILYYMPYLLPPLSNGSAGSGTGVEQTSATGANAQVNQRHCNSARLRSISSVIIEILYKFFSHAEIDSAWLYLLYKDSTPLFGIEFSLNLDNLIPYQKELYRR